MRHSTQIGQYGIEYVERLGDQWRLVGAVEADQDEVRVEIGVVFS